MVPIHILESTTVSVSQVVISCHSEVFSLIGSLMLVRTDTMNGSRTIYLWKYVLEISRLENSKIFILLKGHLNGMARPSCCASVGQGCVGFCGF